MAEEKAIFNRKQEYEKRKCDQPCKRNVERKRKKEITINTANYRLHAVSIASPCRLILQAYILIKI